MVELESQLAPIFADRIFFHPTDKLALYDVVFEIDDMIRAIRGTTQCRRSDMPRHHPMSPLEVDVLVQILAGLNAVPFFLCVVGQRSDSPRINHLRLLKPIGIGVEIRARYIPRNRRSFDSPIFGGEVIEDGDIANIVSIPVADI